MTTATAGMPPGSGDLHEDAVRELRWSMSGAGLTPDKIAVMDAVLRLPVVEAALQSVAEALRPRTAWGVVADAARRLGDTVHHRILRNALAIDYAGDGKDLGARRRELAEQYNRSEAHRAAVPESARGMYDVEQKMLRALVTSLGAPASRLASSVNQPTRAASSRPESRARQWLTRSQDVTCRLRGRACSEVEVATEVQAAVDSIGHYQVWYRCDGDTRPARFTMYEGGFLEGDRYVGERGLREATVRLPRAFSAGERHRLRYDIAYSGEKGDDEPFFAFNVVYPNDLLVIRLAFDLTELPVHVWLLDEVPMYAGRGDRNTSPRLVPDATGYIEARFVEPAVGWKYGIAWDW